jgi:hypothetical protein
MSTMATERQLKNVKKITSSEIAVSISLLKFITCRHCECRHQNIDAKYYEISISSLTMDGKIVN